MSLPTAAQCPLPMGERCCGLAPPCSRIPTANPRGSVCFAFPDKPYINFKNSLPEKLTDIA